MQNDFGMIGLAVMGQNFVLNLADNGYKVSVFNRTYSKTEEFLKQRAEGKTIEGFSNLKEYVDSLSLPRKIMLLVKAGRAVDETVEELLPLLSSGDIIIDGGNSFYKDTIRRSDFCQKKGIHFFGMGVSGGEEGARHGPSLMPGGNKEVWNLLEPILQKVSAKAKEDGAPCVAYIGPGGAGHYVKMVHNGIEYGDIQIIAEIYSIMHGLLQQDCGKIAETFKKWNEGILESYLVEAGGVVFSAKDKDGSFLIEHILDKAGQKGTGKWTSQEALDLGFPLTLITEAVFARCLSSLKEQRERMESLFDHKVLQEEVDLTTEDLELAMYGAKILSYTQGFYLLALASREYKWELNLGECAKIWRGGCIIRSRFLADITRAFGENAQLELLIENDFFKKEMERSVNALRKVALCGLKNGLALPCMNAAITFFDGLCAGSSSANVIQGLRDYFGAHTFERTNNPGHFETFDWLNTGRTQEGASTTYNR